MTFKSGVAPLKTPVAVTAGWRALVVSLLGLILNDSFYYGPDPWVSPMPIPVGVAPWSPVAVVAGNTPLQRCLPNSFSPCVLGGCLLLKQNLIAQASGPALTLESPVFKHSLIL